MKGLKKIVAVMVLVIVLSGCSLDGKYEGKTAQEWSEQYDDVAAENESLKSEIETLKESNVVSEEDLEFWNSL